MEWCRCDLGFVVAAHRPVGSFERRGTDGEGDWRCAKKVEDRSRRTELSVEYGFVDDRVVLRTCPSKGLGGSPRREDVFGGGIVLFFESREGRVWRKEKARRLSSGSLEPKN